MPLRERDLSTLCGLQDGGLRAVAVQVLQRKLSGRVPWTQAEIAEAMRKQGSPYVWPRAWTAKTEGTRSELLRSFTAWHGRVPSMGESRCGVAEVQLGEQTVASVVVADALADLTPLPLRGRVGGWTRYEAQMLVPAARAELCLVGPDGLPRTVPTHMEKGRAHAVFALDRPGRFTVQLLLETAGGMRPALESVLFAEVDPVDLASPPPPNHRFVERSAGTGAIDELVRLTNEFRRAAGVAPLSRDARLDRLATEHVRRMRSEGRVAHDLGSGDPAARLASFGLSAGVVGENAAHAETLALAQRSLEESPSHRANLLRREFDRVGFGMAVGENGSVWVAEFFAGALK